MRGSSIWRGLTGMKLLKVYGAQIDDAGVGHLEKMVNLKNLELDYTGVCDEKSAAIKRLSQPQRPVAGRNDENHQRRAGPPLPESAA